MPQFKWSWLLIHIAVLLPFRTLGRVVMRNTETSSLFNPSSNKPELQDIRDYFCDLGPGVGDQFDFSFLAVVWAITEDNPGRLVKLFSTSEDRDPTTRLIYYEPVYHQPREVEVAYASSAHWNGRPLNYTSSDPGQAGPFETRWWIAALHGALKSAWNEPGARNEYEWNIKSWLDTIDQGNTEIPIGRAEVKALHWIMSVLLKRNVRMERLLQSLNSERNQARAEAVRSGPAVWAGWAGDIPFPQGWQSWDSQTEDGRKKIEDYQASDNLGAYHLKEMMNDAQYRLTNRTAEVEVNLADGNWGFTQLAWSPILFTLDQPEEWRDDWYQREGIPMFQPAASSSTTDQPRP